MFYKKKIQSHLTQENLICSIEEEDPLEELTGVSDLKDENYELYDMNRVLEGDCKIQFLTFHDLEGKAAYWHSSAHVLGQIMELMWGVYLTHGPPIQNGFFYDCYMGENVIIRFTSFICIRLLANLILKKWKKLVKR